MAVADTALSIGGEGRFGGAFDITNSTAAVESRMQLNFTVTTETDSGVQFGIFTRVRASGGANATFSGPRVSASFSGLTVSVGNVSGAIESHSAAAGGTMGYTGMSFANFGGVYATGTDLQLYTSIGGGARQRIGASYAIDGLSVGVSYQRAQPAVAGVATTATEAAVAPVAAQASSVEVAGSYTMEGFTVSAGASTGAARYQTARVAYNAGDFGVSLIGTRFSGNTHITAGGTYNLGDMGTIGAYAGQHAGANVGGVSYRYGLGGGATIGAGIERVATGDNKAEVGVAFSF